MANAVVLDVGDVMDFDTGQDMLALTAIHFRVFITLPDNTLLEKTNADGVSMTHPDSEEGAEIENPGNRFIYYRTESDVCAQDGVLKCSARFGNEFHTYSQPVYGEYTVRRRNQTT